MYYVIYIYQDLDKYHIIAGFKTKITNITSKFRTTIGKEPLQMLPARSQNQDTQKVQSIKTSCIKFTVHRFVGIAVIYIQSIKHH